LAVRAEAIAILVREEMPLADKACQAMAATLRAARPWRSAEAAPPGAEL
jgi:hypothetical protein